MTWREAARQGGLACLAKYGRDHFRQIGKRGYATTLARYWQGEKAAYWRWLSGRGWDAAIDALVDRHLDRLLAEGAEIACYELPILDDLE